MTCRKDSTLHQWVTDMARWPWLLLASIVGWNTGALATNNGYPPPPGPYRIGPIDAPMPGAGETPIPLTTPAVRATDTSPNYDGNTLFGTPQPSATTSNPRTQPPPPPAFVDRDMATPQGPANRPAADVETTWRDQPRQRTEAAIPRQPSEPPPAAGNVIFRPAERLPY